jgi:hypothetical protein
MIKNCILFFLIFFCLHSSYAQNDNYVYPVHFIKFDFFKSLSQIHIDYERYNGKKDGFEIGVNLYYPNPFLRNYVSLQGDLKSDICAFHYWGAGVELKRKFYFPKKKWNPYVGPEVFYRYKYVKNANVLMDGHLNLSDATWYKIYRRKLTAGVIGVVGFSKGITEKISMDVNAGIGICYVDMTTIVNDHGEDRYYYKIDGKNDFITSVFQLSFKFCYGIKGKPHKTTLISQ